MYRFTCEVKVQVYHGLVYQSRSIDVSDIYEVSRVCVIAILMIRGNGFEPIMKAFIESIWIHSNQVSSGYVVCY